MITPDELYEVNKLKRLKEDYTDCLDSFDSEYVTSKVGIVGINTNSPTITKASEFFYYHFKGLEAELTEVVKAKLVAEIAEIDLKIAVYIGEDHGVDEELTIFYDNFKELAENLIVTATEAQEALKQSNLRWVRLENGNWTRLPEDTVAPTPKEEAIDEPEKKVKSVTGKWDRLDASGPPLPIFYTPLPLATMLPSFATVDSGTGKPKPPTKPNISQ
jgi:hypothetical protein